MTCTECQSSTATNGQWRRYDAPKCVYCAARLMKQLELCKSPTSAQIEARRQVVLADAVAYGHQEALVRALAKDGPVVEPVARK